MNDDEDDGGTRLLRILGVLLVLVVIGQVALIAFTVADPPSARDPPPPDTEWTIERLNASFVRVTHAGGEPIDASQLVLTVNGRQRHVDWSGQVERGDAVVVDAVPGSVVRIFWVHGLDEDRELLVERRVPSTAADAG